MHTKGSSKVIGILFVILIVAAACVVYWFVRTQLPPAGPTDSLSGIPALSVVKPSDASYGALTSNPVYALGATLLQQGKTQDALDAYKKALSTTSDPFQQGIINLQIAIIQWIQDPVASIPALKAIATNPDYAYNTRAYALQYIAQAHDLALDPKQASAAVTATFNTDPFSQMLTGTKVGLAYRHVYDLADSLYPLPVSEAMSAGWYATQIVALNATSTKNASTTAAYKAQIDANLSAMQAAIAQNAPYPTLAPFSAQAIGIQADVLRRLSYAKLATSDDVEAAYKQSIAAYSKIAGQPNSDDSMMLFAYSVYLSSTFGSSRASDISAVMAPLYAEPSPQQSILGRFLKSLHGAAHTSRANALSIASVDPNFKSFLVSLGWTNADFQ